MKRTDYVTPLTLVLYLQDSDVIRTSTTGFVEGVGQDDNELPLIGFGK